MQVDPIKPKFKPPETKPLKLTSDILLSNFAFKFNLRRYNLAVMTISTVGYGDVTPTSVGRCRLTR